MGVLGNRGRPDVGRDAGNGSPSPIFVGIHGGKRLVAAAGFDGKAVAEADPEAKSGKLRDYRYHLLPVCPTPLTPD